MLFTDKIPHLTFYRQKTYLPRDLNNVVKTVVLLNTKTTNEFDKIYNSTQLVNSNRFNKYYIEQLYRVKVGSQPVAIGRKINERKTLYKNIKKKNSKMLCIIDTKQVQQFNSYVDLAWENELFFSKINKIPLMKRATLYIDFLAKQIQNPLYQGLTKVMIIDTDEWIPTGNKFTYDNPVSLLYYAFWRNKEIFASLGDIDIIFKSTAGMIRLNPSLTEANNLTQYLKAPVRNKFTDFKKELVKLIPKLETLVPEEDDTEITKREEARKIVESEIMKRRLFTGGDLPVADDVKEELESAFRDEVLGQLDKIDTPDLNEETIDNIIAGLKKNKSTLSKISQLMEEKTTGQTNQSLKRDDELRKAQKQLKIDNLGSLEDLEKQITLEAPVMTVNNVADKVQTINKNVQNIRYTNFDKEYVEKVYKRDTVNVFNNLSRKTLPVFIRNVEIEDTSDIMNYKETWTVTLEDSNRVRHTIKVDMPKFIEGRYMYTGGNDKFINRQFMNKPVVKTGPDTVQITSNYNKIFIYRQGQKLKENLEQFKKFLANSPTGITALYGDVTKNNKEFLTQIEYDELSKIYSVIKSSNVTILFDQIEMRNHMKDNNITHPGDEYLVYGYKGKGKTQADLIFNKVDDDFDFTANLIEMLVMSNDNNKALFNRLSGGTKFMYTSATIMGKKTPLLFFLSFLYGFTKVLRTAGVKFRFSDKRVKIEQGESIVKFNDGYLIYDNTNMCNNLLMNAISTMDTELYSYEEMDTQEPYLTIFEKIYGARNAGLAFINYRENMIDPITFEVLNKLNYPTDFLNLVLYANKLLGDNQSLQENNMNLYRIRGNEVAAAILYKEVATAYEKYLATAGNNRPVKISVPRDAVLKRIVALTTVEDVSRLNPIYEVDKERTITPKGYVGLNLSQAYTIDKRAYDPTMLGIVGMSSSPDANVGVNRSLSMEPNIKNVRGYIDIKNDKPEELTDAQIFTAAEMLTPLGAAKDDSARTAMASKQSKHIIPTKKSSPVLISNGAEMTLPYYLSNTFAYTAEDDGKVVEVNEESNLIIIEYKNGKHQAIDMNTNIVKNGAGGFNLDNKMQCKLKAGDIVKKNDILATHDKFFKEDLFGTRFTLGSLQKVACYSCDSTYEDSSMVTRKMSDDMSTFMDMEVRVVLTKTATIGKIVKVGERVNVGDELISFSQTYDENNLNEFLAAVADEMKEEIKSLGNKPIKSKYCGEIADIKLYAGCDLEEMSPSIQEVFAPYYKKIKSKKKTLEKYDKDSSIVKCGLLLNEPVEKIVDKYGKIKGEQVDDGVLICFFIRVQDNLGIGDKITFYGPLKTTVGRVIPEGEEMWSEYRPGEEVSSMVAPNSVIQRMVPSVVLTMMAYKVLVEGTRQCIDIWQGK